MSWLSDLFGGGDEVRQAVRDGALIVDLRTAYEYDQGHIPHSVNIPLDRLRSSIDRLRDFGKPVILCCAGSGHCWEGVSILREAGISRVINGGDWQSLWRKLRR
jgi:phage shock protein E